MEEGFYHIENKSYRDEINKILVRKSVIDAICEDREKGYFTEYKSVVKLCRLCLSDILKRLVELGNDNVCMYKKYAHHLKMNEKDMSDTMKKELKVHMSKVSIRYSRYVDLIKKFKKVKIWSKKCYICSLLLKVAK